MISGVVGLGLFSIGNILFDIFGTCWYVVREARSCLTSPSLYRRAPPAVRRLVTSPALSQRRSVALETPANCAASLTDHNVEAGLTGSFVGDIAMGFPMDLPNSFNSLSSKRWTPFASIEEEIFLACSHRRSVLLETPSNFAAWLIV